MNPRLPDYLRHIVEAVDRIHRYTAPMNEAGFVGSELVQDAVTRNLEIIGEASRNIETRCPAFAAQHPDLPLSFAWQMRNVLAHGYFKVDLALVWQTVQRDLPALRQGVQAALDAGGGDADPIANA